MKILAPIILISRRLMKKRKLLVILIIVLLALIFLWRQKATRDQVDEGLVYPQGSLQAEKSLQQALDAKSQDKPDQAIAFIEPVYRGDPDNILCLEVYAWAKYRQRNYDQSAELYQKLVEKSRTATYLSYLGNALRDTGKNGEAIKAYEQAIELNINFNTAYQNLINVYKAQNWQGKKNLVAFLQTQASNTNNKVAGRYLEEVLKQ